MMRKIKEKKNWEIKLAGKKMLVKTKKEKCAVPAKLLKKLLWLN